MSEALHFVQPEWFWALLPLAWLLWFLHHSGAADTAWRRIVDANLLPYLLVTPAGQHSRKILWLSGIGWLLAVIALADPVWERQPQPVFRNQAARVVVLDLSNSMLATDIKPSRLARARYKVTDILKQSADGQTGLVVFAGDAFTVAPLTTDTETIQSLLSPLEPALMPVQGSRADLGLRQAGELLAQAGVPQGDILLITDGFSGADAIDAAKDLRDRGYRISVLGVGASSDIPAPNGRGGFIRDQNDNVVLVKLDTAALKQLATAGGGRYTGISSAETDVDYLLSMPTVEISERPEQAGLETEQWQSNGPWLAVLLLPFAALAFRRGWLLALVILVSGNLVTPPSAMAGSWDDLWQRRDQQAERAMQAGDLQQAEQLAQDPLRRGAAAYRAGRYEQALQHFGAAASADANYNRGNALANLGDYKEAIAAYDQALAVQPGMPDAEYNNSALEKFLQQQQQEDQRNGKKDGSENSDSDQQTGNDQQNQDNAGQDGEENSNSNQQADQEKNEGGESEPQTAQKQADAGQDQSEQYSPDSDSQEPSSNESTEGNKPSTAELGEDQGYKPAKAEADPLSREERQAAEQWLRRIPDDPGGLLRRKFLYQYRQRAEQAKTDPQQEW